MPSTKDGNSQEKTSTFKKCTVQVIILAIFLIKKKETFPRQQNIDNPAFVFPSKSNLQFISFTFFELFDTPELFEATLWKKGKDSKQFFKSTFLLSQKDFTLRYFIKEDVSSSSVIRPFSLQLYKHSSVDSGQIPLFLIFLNHLIKTKSKVPKAVINMKDLNAVFQPEKIGHATGLQISYVDDERSKNLFVYHEDGQVRASSQMYAACSFPSHIHRVIPYLRQLLFLAKPMSMISYR